MKYCPKCKFANPNSSIFCGQDGTPLSASSQNTIQKKSNKSGFVLFGSIGFAAFFVIALLVLAVSCSTDDLKSNHASTSGESVSSTNQSNSTQSVKISSSANTATVKTKTSSNSKDYSEKEYAIYSEVVSAHSSESESQSLIRIGKKYGISPREVKDIAERVMRIMYSGSGGKDKEQQIRSALSQIVQVKSITVSGDFVGVSYIEERTAFNDADVKRNVTDGMPKVLAAIFSVSGIERTQIKAFYLTTDGTEKDVAGLTTNRPDFSLHKNAESYSTFWQR